MLPSKIDGSQRTLRDRQLDEPLIGSPEFANESMTEILKSWNVHGLQCKLWQEPGGHYRGCVFVNDAPAFCAEAPLSAGETAAAQAVESLAKLATRPPGVQVVTEATPFVDLAIALSPSAGMPEEERLIAPFKILEDVEVVPVDWSVFRSITAACDPPGANKGLAIELRRPLYAFVRYGAPREPMYHWDSDERPRVKP